MPRAVYRDLRSSVPEGLLDEVMAAYAVAGEALAAGDPERALPYLEWAKSVAARSGMVREALGIARYQRGEWAAATAELTAYRRLTGMQDQNHVLADCARALGKHDKVAEEVEAMVDAEKVSRDRVVEGLIVLASDRADRGDLPGAMNVLERADLHPRQVEAWHPRVWYVAADLSDRLGKPDEARDYLEAVVAVDPDFLDAAERLGAG
ncbi:MAG: tetratricopeptide repeat protein [Nitriliruptorales bacterium]|nr:tetratricopeptide repeat protein [Nitriliruptorales bacterium]